MDNIIIDTGNMVYVKKEYRLINTIIPAGTIVELREPVYKNDPITFVYYNGRSIEIPVEFITPIHLVEESKSVKNDIIDDKLRWDLLPMEEIEDIVRVYHAGAKKYGPNTWQNLDNGFERYRAAAARHIMAYLKGERMDKETNVHHLAAAAWNVITMLWYDKHGKGLI